MRAAGASRSMKGGPGEMISEEVRHRGGRAGLRCGEGGLADGAVVGTCAAGCVMRPCWSRSSRGLRRQVEQGGRCLLARVGRVEGEAVMAGAGRSMSSCRVQSACRRSSLEGDWLGSASAAWRCQNLTEACAVGPLGWSRVGGLVRAWSDVAPQPSLGVRGTDSLLTPDLPERAQAYSKPHRVLASLRA